MRNNQEPIRLIFLSSVGGDVASGGHEIRFLRKLSALAPRFKTLFVSANSQFARDIQSLGIETANINPRNLPFDDWDRKGAYTFLQRLKMKFWFHCHRRNYRRLLQEFRPALVHSGWLQTDSLLAVSEKSTPLVVMSWGSDILVRPFDNRRNLRKTRFILSKADLFLGDCQAAADSSAKILGRPVVQQLMFPWGVDRRIFNPGNRAFAVNQPLRIVVVKNLVEVARLETMIEAAKILAEKKFPFVMDVYGAGEKLPELQTLRDKYGLAHNVHFHGRVANEKLPEILRSSDIYLSCNSSEGTSLAMMEAISCGAIPVVTRLPAYQEWVVDKENGFLFDVGDAPALAKVLGEITIDQQTKLRAMYEKNLRLAAESFDWDKNFAKLVAGYETLLAQ